MKKTLLALAVGAVATGAVWAEDKGPTVYGKVNVSLDQVEVDTGSNANNKEDTWQMNSNASRLGVKGEADLGGGLSAIYQLEYEVFVDDGNNKSCKDTDYDVLDASGNPDTITVTQCSGDGPFSQRNIFAGIKGGFGTIKLGKFDTPLKESQGSFDQFNDLAGDIKNVMSGEARSQDIIEYVSPKLADAITVKVAFQPGEETDSTNNCTATKTDCDDNGLTDGIGFSAEYAQGAIFASLGYGKDMKDEDIESPFGANDHKLDITRLTVMYKGDKFGGGVLYQMAEETDEVPATKAREETGIAVSGYFKATDKLKVKAQYAMVEVDNVGLKTDENNLMSLGADYSLGKKTTVFGYLTEREKDTKETGSKVAETSTMGFGLEHKF